MPRVHGAMIASHLIPPAADLLLVHNAPDPNEAFGLQRFSTRFLDPTVYDWPAAHWANPRWGDGVAVLPWASGRAIDIVNRDWQPRWEEAVRDHLGGLLEIRSPLELVSDVRDADRHAVAMPGGPEQAGLVLECIGPGRERVWPGDDREPPTGFRAFEYWDRADPVAQWTYRLPAGARAIVSGGGDGALQEFLWLATGRNGRELLDDLRIDHALAPFAREIEDRHQRSYVWLSTEGSHLRDHGLLTRWHREWRDCVDRLLADEPRKRRIFERIDALVPVEPEVELAHPCEHFGYSFALNRVLVLLLDRWFLARFGRSHLRPGAAITAVSGLDHDVCESPGTCSGRPHRVLLSGRGCRGHGLRAPPEKLDAEVVVIRHGIVGNEHREGMPVPRQIVAYAPLG